MIKFDVMQGDSKQRLKDIADSSIDSCVCDPPYEIAFLGRKWDATGIAFDVDFWKEVYRVLKPGAHLLSFGAARTYHRVAVAIEDAGFEIRDSIHWTYASGMPKGINISKAIDKKLGGVRKELRPRMVGGRPMVSSIGLAGPGGEKKAIMITEAGTPEAAQFEGWNTALKPCHEPIIVARKPLEGTVVDNVLKHGTGGYNIDSARIPLANGEQIGTSWNTVGDSSDTRGSGYGFKRMPRDPDQERWPTNFLMSHSAFCRQVLKSSTNSQVSMFEDEDDEPAPGAEDVVWDCDESCPCALLDSQSGYLKSGKTQGGKPISDKNSYSGGWPDRVTKEWDGGEGGASRFFEAFPHEDPDYDPFIYCPKPSADQKHQGAEAFYWAVDDTRPSNYRRITFEEWQALGDEEERLFKEQGGKGARPHLRSNGNIHATVKPVKLMARLVSLVTQPGGTVLDPFCGSGTSGVAAVQSKCNFIGIEWDSDYHQIAKSRIKAAAIMCGGEGAGQPPEVTVSE